MPIALDWFDELCCIRGIEECDRVIDMQRLGKLDGKSISRDDLESVVEDLGMCLEFDLKRSKAKCLAILHRALTQQPKLFTSKKEMLGQVALYVKDHKDCHDVLWNALELYLPSSISSEKSKLLLENDLLHEFIYLEISLHPFPRSKLQRGEHRRLGGQSPDVSVSTTNATCRGN